MNNAAIYCRSSKDRSDVSIAAQKHELMKLAQARALTIVRSFEDAVQSGSTDDRPAFQELIAAVKDRGRGWSHLLVLDTSRVARGRFIAQAFKRQCAKYGVTILYANMPETDPISTVILESVFEAIDEVHSLMSREKGITGMAENIRQGYRAGGRAPVGYRLKYVPTGTIRDGKPVMKSRLEPAAEAELVRIYLQARAQLIPRGIARQRSGIAMPSTSLVAVEWNALTYAGHTVWNRHRELDRFGNRTGRKLRPREEWQIHRDTHQALITDIEAERILRTLETSSIGEAVRRARCSISDDLLSGLLQTEDGHNWIGHGGKAYRLRAVPGRRGSCILTASIDGPVMEQLGRDLRSDLFVRRMVEEIRADAEGGAAEAELRAEISRLSRERKRASDLAIASDEGEVFSRLVHDRTRQIRALEQEIDALTADAVASNRLRNLTVADVRGWIGERPDRELLHDLVARVVVEPKSDCCRVEYRKPEWLGVASPRIRSVPPLVSHIIRLRRAAGEK